MSNIRTIWTTRWVLWGQPIEAVRAERIETTGNYIIAEGPKRYTELDKTYCFESQKEAHDAALESVNYQMRSNDARNEVLRGYLKALSAPSAVAAE
jgi:hypothetical protein